MVSGSGYESVRLYVYVHSVFDQCEEQSAIWFLRMTISFCLVFVTRPKGDCLWSPKYTVVERIYRVCEGHMECSFRFGKIGAGID